MFCCAKGSNYFLWEGHHSELVKNLEEKKKPPVCVCKNIDKFFKKQSGITRMCRLFLFLFFALIDCLDEVFS